MTEDDLKEFLRANLSINIRASNKYTTDGIEPCVVVELWICGEKISESEQ